MYCGTTCTDIWVFRRFIMIPMMHVVGNVAHHIEKILPRPITAAPTPPVCRMQILDHIDATVAQVREEVGKRNRYMFHVVAAIIQHDVDATHLCNHAFEEFFIDLRTDSYLPRQAIILNAVGINIDTLDDSIGAEVLPPHLQAAALAHADFKEANLAAAKWREIAVVKGKVVMPLVNNIILVVAEDIEKFAAIIIFFLNRSPDVQFLVERKAFKASRTARYAITKCAQFARNELPDGCCHTQILRNWRPDCGNWSDGDTFQAEKYPAKR